MGSPFQLTATMNSNRQQVIWNEFTTEYSFKQNVLILVSDFADSSQGSGGSYVLMKPSMIFLNVPAGSLYRG